MRVTTHVTMILIILLLSSCSRGYKPMPPSQQLFQAGAASQEYTIQSGDVLDIKFFYNPELNEVVTVRPDGRISLQLVKEIKVVGATPAQLNDMLSQRYASLVQKPEITIIVRTFAGQKIYVDGEVYKAGVVSLTDPMTVLQAVSQAGGLKDTAAPDEIIVFRKGPDNNFVTTTVNLRSAEDVNQHMILRPNDIVFVPKSGIANVDLWIDQHIRKVIPIPMGIGFDPL